MNELLGTLIPLLMSGYGLSDFLRLFGGAGGASAMDGLQGMMRSQAINARMASPLVQNQSTINAAAETFVGRLGFNPYTGVGQGVTSLIGNLYHFAPDTMGTILGVPYGGQFFSTIANGAAGISQASGMGGVDIFNPYSVLAAHQNTNNMAKMMYDFGVRKDGGYDVSYGHGLNMGEMGKVAQRILSSQIPYMDDDGRRLDLSRDEKGDYVNGSDAEKFSSNLKKLGSKFNEAVSSMSKLTGSVDDALRVMDQMAGGNFLGGSVEQAKSVAERARRLAATIRITSAIAGTSPMEAFANMQGLAQTMAGATGMSSYIAGSSGYSSMMGTMAASATAAYGMWAAMNPDASQEQKAQALLAANGRATRYASENGSAFSAMVADNMHLFSEKDISEIETANREGHPNTVADLVMRRIGADMYSRYMTDPAFQIAARNRVSSPGNEDRAEVLRRLDSAGMQGGLDQAETEGNKRIMDSMMSDLDTDLSTMSGRGGQSLRKERDGVVLGRLRSIAGGYGLDQKASMKMSEDELVSFLESRPGMDMRRLGRIVNSAKIEAAEQQIDRMTMTESEDSYARSRALSAINSSGYYSAEGKRELSERIRAGEDIESVLRDFTNPMKPNEARKVIEGVTRGRLTSEQARVMKGRFSDMKETQQVDATTRERIGSIREDVRRSEVSDAGLLKGYMASEGFGDMAGKFALEKFSGTVNELLASGQVSTGGDDKDLTGTYETAAKRMLSKMIGPSLGNMSGKDLDNMLDRASKDVVIGIRAGKDMGKTLSESLGSLSDEQRKAIGGDGIKRLDKIIGDAENEDSKLVRTQLNIGSLLDESKNVIGEKTREAGISNASGIDKVQYSAESLGQKGVKDYKTAVLSFREKIRDIGKNGMISFKVDDKTLSDMFSKGGTRMVMDVLGGEGKRLGDLEGKELEKLSAAVNENMMSFVNSENVSFDEGFVRALGQLTPEQRASIGKEGMEQVQKLIDQQKEGGIDGISSRNYFSSVAGVADEMNKKGRMASVDRMDEIIKGNFGKKNAGEATKELMDLSRSLGILKGDENGDRKIVTDAVRNFVSESFGAYGISKKDEEAIVNSAGNMFKGDYRSAIKAAAMERGRRTGNSRLMSLAKAVGERDDVNTSILGNVLKSIKPDAGRKPSFAAIAQSGSADLAGLNMAAVSAAVTGMDMGEVLINQYAPDLLSVTDDAASDAMMNRIPNALKVGGNTFAKNAVANTKKQMVSLGKALRENGISSADKLKLALSEGDSEDAKAARDNLSKAIGGMDTSEGKKNLNLLRTINEGAKIGGKSAFEMMIGGENAFKSLGKSKSADADVLNITRESNRRDSDAYKIMDKIGGLVKGMSAYFDTHTIKVTVDGGRVDTSGSKNKVVTM